MIDPNLHLIFFTGQEIDKRGKTLRGKSANTERFSEIFWHGDYIRRFRYYFGENQRNVGKASIRNTMGSEKLGVLMIGFLDFIIPVST